MDVRVNAERVALAVCVLSEYALFRGAPLRHLLLLLLRDGFLRYRRQEAHFFSRQHAGQVALERVPLIL